MAKWVNCINWQVDKSLSRARQINRGKTTPVDYKLKLETTSTKMRKILHRLECCCLWTLIAAVRRNPCPTYHNIYSYVPRVSDRKSVELGRMLLPDRPVLDKPSIKGTQNLKM